MCLWCSTNINYGVWSWKPSTDLVPLGSDFCYARDMPNGAGEKLKTWSTFNKCLKTILSFIWEEKYQIVSAERQQDAYDIALIYNALSAWMCILYDYKEVIKTLYTGRTLASAELLSGNQRALLWQFSADCIELTVACSCWAGKLKETIEKNNSHEVCGEDRQTGAAGKEINLTSLTLNYLWDAGLLSFWRKGCNSFPFFCWDWIYTGLLKIIFRT